MHLPSFATVLWWLVGASILIIQFVDIFAFENRLRHLTNWAFLLHMGLCFYRVYVQNTNHGLSVPLLNFGWSTAVFVAVGIGTIMDEDNTMILKFSSELSPALVHVGNTVMHFVPPAAWFAVMAGGYRGEIRRYVQTTPAITALVQLNVPSILFALAYASLFNPRMEYQGPHINYRVLFSAGITSILASAATALLFSV